MYVTETKRKISDVTDPFDDMMALWSDELQSDHASEGIGIVLSSRLVSGVNDYGMSSWVLSFVIITPICFYARKNIEKSGFFLGDTGDDIDGDKYVITRSGSEWVGNKGTLIICLMLHGTKYTFISCLFSVREIRERSIKRSACNLQPVTWYRLLYHEHDPKTHFAERVIKLNDGNFDIQSIATLR